MAYVVQRKHRFYVVDHAGTDPRTGRERRRWHAAGSTRSEAEAVRRRIECARSSSPCHSTVAGFLIGSRLATKTQLTGPTRRRYRWMVVHNIARPSAQSASTGAAPKISMPSTKHLQTRGGRRREGLSPKTVLEIHRVLSAALDLAVDRHLVEAPVKTRTSRRRIDLDHGTVDVLGRWRRRLCSEGEVLEQTTPMFLDRDHELPSPESLSQLFTRTVASRTSLPRIR